MDDFQIKITKSGGGFTLLELLIVIAIIAILSAVLIFVLNPAETLRKGRDSQRINDLNTINRAIAFYVTVSSMPDLDGSDPLRGVCETNVFVGKGSGPDITVPQIIAEKILVAGGATSTAAIDGSGWIPINFASLNQSPISRFSLDPSYRVTNPADVTDDDLLYLYGCDIDTTWELNANLESSQFSQGGSDDRESTDGGNNNNVLEVGTKLTILGTSGVGGGGGPWSCGDALVDSRDSKSYSTVSIGSECWMAKHINVGTLIAGASNQTNNATIEKYCYSDTESNCTSDGGLYQWAEAMQYAASCNGTGAPPNDACATPVRGICPSGWHIPSHYEYVALERAVCTSGTCATDFPYDITTTGWRGTNEGTKLKVGGSSGFEGLLAGYRYTDGSFYNRGTTAIIWSSLESGSNAWLRYLDSGLATVYRNAYDKLYGFSVRCLKD